MALFVATMIWPDVCSRFVWISLFLAVDPIVQLLDGRSISGAVARGRWDPVLVLFIGTLICGFFWEFWNFWSMPKWTYRIEYRRLVSHFRDASARIRRVSPIRT